ncbi:MAG TPA: radical SAM protein [Microlunatus sp.]
MRLTLVDNFLLPAENELHLLDVHPHLGLLSLAAAAGADGHDVTIYDPKWRVRTGQLPYDQTIYAQVADELLADDPEAIGFTTLGCSFLFTVGVGRELERRAPEIPILLGGPHATMLARPILETYSPFDIVVRHEAEQTLPLLLDHLDGREFGDVPGITWRAASGIAETAGAPRIDDLDSLPLLSYDLYPMDQLDLPLMRVEAGRGCPFACTFCSTATFFQRRYRLKSPQRLVSEMDAIRDRYAPSEFKLDHDLFTVNRRKVQEFCQAVADHGHQWRVSARVDCVDEDLLEQMAAAGCVGLYFGVETGSQRMQKIAAKRLHLDLVEPTLDICERLGIEATASFITGYPEEEATDQDATLDMLGDMFGRPRRACLPQLHILTPEPGTPLWDELGDALQFDGYATPFNSWLLRPTDRDEVRAQPEIFASYHFYPGQLTRQTHIAVIEWVDLLRTLGHPTLAALIASHGGSLATLVRQLIAAASCDPARPRAADLAEYVRRTLGDQNPLTSVVRYHAFCLTAPSDDPFQGLVGGRYRIPEGLQSLANVHDCTEVLARLESGADLDGIARVSYLRLPDQPTPLLVDPAVADLMNLLRTCDGFEAATLLVGSGNVTTEPEWVDDLVAAGLLVTA